VIRNSRRRIFPLFGFGNAFAGALIDFRTFYLAPSDFAAMKSMMAASGQLRIILHHEQLYRFAGFHPARRSPLHSIPTRQTGGTIFRLWCALKPDTGESRNLFCDPEFLRHDHSAA
jgi:hypothetical protein